MTTTAIPYERCAVPGSAMLVINHPQAGIFALIDHSVPDQHVSTMLDVMRRGMDLRPDLIPAEHEVDALRRPRLRRLAAEHATMLTTLLGRSEPRLA